MSNNVNNPNTSYKLNKSENFLPKKSPIMNSQLGKKHINFNQGYTKLNTKSRDISPFRSYNKQKKPRTNFININNQKNNFGPKEPKKIKIEGDLLGNTSMGLRRSKTPINSFNRNINKNNKKLDFFSKNKFFKISNGHNDNGLMGNSLSFSKNSLKQMNKSKTPLNINNNRNIFKINISKTPNKFKASPNGFQFSNLNNNKKIFYDTPNQSNNKKNNYLNMNLTKKNSNSNNLGSNGKFSFFQKDKKIRSTTPVLKSKISLIRNINNNSNSNSTKGNNIFLNNNNRKYVSNSPLRGVQKKNNNNNLLFSYVNSSLLPNANNKKLNNGSNKIIGSYKFNNNNGLKAKNIFAKPKGQKNKTMVYTMDLSINQKNNNINSKSNISNTNEEKISNNIDANGKENNINSNNNSKIISNSSNKIINNNNLLIEENNNSNSNNNEDNNNNSNNNTNNPLKEKPSQRELTEKILDINSMNFQISSNKSLTPPSLSPIPHSKIPQSSLLNQLNRDNKNNNTSNFLDQPNNNNNNNSSVSASNQKEIRKKIKCMHELSKTGYAGEDEKKINQDNYFIFHNFIGIHEHIFMAVCDGHGQVGQEISGFLKENLPIDLNHVLKNQNINILEDNIEDIANIISEVFVDENYKLSSNKSINSYLSGSTCVSVIYTPVKLITANVGDSRCMLGKYIDGKWKSVDLTRDHKPSLPDEYKRIIQHGGRIEPMRDDDGTFIGPDRVWRKNQDLPGLAMSRSFGDRIAHSVGVAIEPEVKEYKFQKEDKFFVIASDGLFEFISSQEIIEIIKDYYTNGDIVECCEYLYKFSRDRWLEEEEDAVDDITILLIFLEDQE